MAYAYAYYGYAQHMAVYYIAHRDDACVCMTVGVHAVLETNLQTLHAAVQVDRRGSARAGGAWPRGARRLQVCASAWADAMATRAV